jgi:hypothetical protein
MVNLLKAKFWVITIGVLLLAIGVVGILLHDQCTSDIEGLTSSVEGEITQPMTLQARAAAGAAFRAIAEFFVAVLCPVLDFIDNLLGGFTFVVFIIAGPILIIIGWYVVP